MKILVAALCLTVGLTSVGLTQEEGSEPKPTIQDLDFLVGTWEVSFDFYNPREPGSEPRFFETGVVTCSYDMEFNGVAKFIVCEGKMDGSNGWKRTFKEYTEFNSLKDSFERIAIYSNWPGMARDLVIFDSEKKVLDVRGTLDVEDHIVERYQDYYNFNDDFSAYERVVHTNFSDMPVNEYNLVFKSTAKKLASSN